MKGIAPYIIIAMNVIAFALMGMDKHKAKRHLRRIPEKTLFAAAVLFGAFGGTLGMLVFHHKTKHWYFELFFPLLAVLQLALAAWLYVSAAP